MSEQQDKPGSEDVEAHRRKHWATEDAEPPEKLGEITNEEPSKDEDDESDFEAHRKKPH